MPTKLTRYSKNLKLSNCNEFKHNSLLYVSYWQFSCEISFSDYRMCRWKYIQSTFFSIKDVYFYFHHFTDLVKKGEKIAGKNSL